MKKYNEKSIERQGNLPNWKQVFLYRLGLPHWSLIDDGVHKFLTYFLEREASALTNNDLAKYCGLSLATLERRVALLKELSVLSSNYQVWRHAKKWFANADYQLHEEGMVMLDRCLSTLELSSVTKTSANEFPWHKLLKNKREMRRIFKDFLKPSILNACGANFDETFKNEGLINSNRYDMCEGCIYKDFLKASILNACDSNTEGHSMNKNINIFLPSFRRINSSSFSQKNITTSGEVEVCSNFLGLENVDNPNPKNEIIQSQSSHNKPNPFKGMKRTKYPQGHAANAERQYGYADTSSQNCPREAKKEKSMRPLAFIKNVPQKAPERKTCIAKPKKSKVPEKIPCQACEKYVDYWNELGNSNSIPKIMKTRAGKPTKGFLEALKFFHALETGKLFRNSRTFNFTPEYLATLNIGKFSKSGYTPEVMFQLVKLASDGYVSGKNMPNSFSNFLYTEFGAKAERYGGGVSRFLEVLSAILSEDTAYHDELVERVNALSKEDRLVFRRIFCTIYHETRNDGERGETTIPDTELESLLACLKVMRNLYDRMQPRLVKSYQVQKSEEEVSFYWFCNLYYEVIGTPEWEDAPMSYLFDKRKPYLGKFIDVLEGIL